MASIRNRCPWRVSIKGAPERDATFPSKKQATVHARVLEAQGIAGLRIAQDCTGAWEVRIRRTGIPTLAKCFETKRAADDWAAARAGEISKREFIGYRAVEKVTAGDLFKRFSEERITPGPAGGPERNRLTVFQTLPLAAIKLPFAKEQIERLLPKIAAGASRP